MTEDVTTTNATVSSSATPTAKTKTSIVAPEESRRTPIIDHDRLFKLLLVMFFREFLELFLPAVAAYTDLSTLTPLDKETLNNLSSEDDLTNSNKTSNKKRDSDIVMQARYNEQGRAFFAVQPRQKYERKGKRTKLEGATFVIHVENQATSQANFPYRMHNYFSRLTQKYKTDIYPVALLSYNSPRRSASHGFRVVFPNREVLNFGYDVIQLNRLDWHDFLHRPNPVASALMAKMQIAPQDRPQVKAECLAMLFKLKLDEEREEFVTNFVEAYLPLEQSERGEFESKLEKLIPTPQKEERMQLLNYWQKLGLERGLEQGLERGLEQGLEQGRRVGLLEGAVIGQRELVSRLLSRKLGQLTPEQQGQINQLRLEQVEGLGEALFDFANPQDLNDWLSSHPA